MFYRAAPLVLGFFLLLGCQGTINKDLQTFKVSPDIIGETDIVRTISRNGYGQIEVLSAKGNNGWFSSALITANSIGIITAEGGAKRLTLKGWTALKEKQLVYGRNASIDVSKSDINYEFFSFDGNRCFHFHKLGYRADNDSLGRYRQLMAGYVCNQSGAAFSDEMVSQFLQNITVPSVHSMQYVANADPVILFQPVRPLLKHIIREGGCSGSSDC